MTILGQVDQFIAEFQPGPDSPDPNMKDHWRVLTERPYIGDCEDFALTVAWIIAGRDLDAMLDAFETGFMELWFVRATTANVTDGPHAVLHVRGLGWMDNLDPEWRASTPHRKRYKYERDYIAAKLRGETPKRKQGDTSFGNTAWLVVMVIGAIILALTL